MNKNKYIQTVETSQLRDDIPSFSPGDTIVVDVRVVEGTRERLQPFEGVVLSIKKRNGLVIDCNILPLSLLDLY